ncbi:LysR family transcriptional regulator [Klebsiella aerogenes]|nr:LysR family transcriptional regulator [Klebsiella aerogenes]
MFRLEDLTLFVRAAALGSFSEAAREAGQQPAQVSAAIKRLETTLNIRLFARSTRSLRLTPEGETWLPYATQMLDTLQAGLQKIQTPGDEVRGTLQIAVPSDLGRNLLLKVFCAFRERHPALRLRLHFSDHLTDVFKDPVDVAFRYGYHEDASFISLPVAPENRLVRLLPDYQGDLTPLNMICPHRKQLSAAVRLLYQEVKSHCEALSA